MRSEVRSVRNEVLEDCSLPLHAPRKLWALSNVPWLLKADIMQVAETFWPLYVYAKRQFLMGPRIRTKKTYKLTGRRPVMTLTHCAGDNEELCLDILRMLLLY